MRCTEVLGEGWGAWKAGRPVRRRGLVLGRRRALSGRKPPVGAGRIRPSGYRSAAPLYWVDEPVSPPPCLLRGDLTCAPITPLLYMLYGLSFVPKMLVCADDLHLCRNCAPGPAPAPQLHRGGGHAGRGGGQRLRVAAGYHVLEPAGRGGLPVRARRGREDGAGREGEASSEGSWRTGHGLLLPPCRPVTPFYGGAGRGEGASSEGWVAGAAGRGGRPVRGGEGR